MRVYDRILMASVAPYGAGDFCFRNISRGAGNGEFVFVGHMRQPYTVDPGIPVTHASFFATERGLATAVELRNLQCSYRP